MLQVAYYLLSIYFQLQVGKGLVKTILKDKDNEDILGRLEETRQSRDPHVY